MKLKFADWLKKEMTTAAATSGGTFTDSIAKFSLPIFSKPVKRKPENKKKD